jgi:hypothetical protein
MLISDPADTRHKFEQHGAHPTLGPTILTGRQYLIELFGSTGSIGLTLARQSLVSQSGAPQISGLVMGWIDAFR